MPSDLRKSITTCVSILDHTQHTVPVTKSRQTELGLLKTLEQHPFPAISACRREDVWRFSQPGCAKLCTLILECSDESDSKGMPYVLGVDSNSPQNDLELGLYTEQYRKLNITHIDT